MSLIVLADLLLIALIGFGAIYAYSRWPGEPKAPASVRGRLPADHVYRRSPARPPRNPSFARDNKNAPATHERPGADQQEVCS